jgi:hypothetical protein
MAYIDSYFALNFDRVSLPVVLEGPASAVGPRPPQAAH